MVEALSLSRLEEHSRNVVALPNLDRFAVSGVYFLWRNGGVVYVGQSVLMSRRIGQHIADGLKRFDAVSAIDCSLSRLAKLEAHYIEALTPEYNACSVAGSARTARASGLSSETHWLPNTPLTDSEAADYLGVSLEQLVDMEESGNLPQRRRLPRSSKRLFRRRDLRDHMLSISLS